MNAVVYTALLGRYEQLNEQPIAKSSDVPFVCYTDNPDLRSDTWELRLVDLRYPWDTVRSSRSIKILAEEVWGKHDRSLWIDNRVILRRDPGEILDKWLRNAEMAVPTHSYRDEVRGEFAEVLRGSLDLPERVREQLAVAERLWPTVLAERPYWTGMLARHHSASVAQTMRTWMDLVLRHSRRDQLSFNLALRLTDQEIERLEVDNFSSEMHEWLIMKKRRDIVFNRAWRYTVLQHALDAAGRRKSELKHALWERRMAER